MSLRGFLRNLGKVGQISNTEHEKIKIGMDSQGAVGETVANHSQHLSWTTVPAQEILESMNCSETLCLLDHEDMPSAHERRTKIRLVCQHA